MDEKIKNKDAEPDTGKRKTNDLEQGLEGTFPGSDPVSATQPGSDDQRPEPSKKTG